MRSTGIRCRRAGFALLALALPLSGGAEGEAAPDEVSLEQLFKLPTAAPTRAGNPRVGGATRQEWEERFGVARTALEDAHEQLRAAQAALGEIAANTDSWQLTAPGANVNSENSPLSFKLRQDIRRHREDIDRAEQAFSELRIEANLAGVPEQWQGIQGESSQDRLAGRNTRPGSANEAVNEK